jgi:transaldolase
VFKKTYQIFKSKGYRLRLLSAAFRNHLHWSEFIGGDVVISPPYRWQLRYNASDVAVVPRIENPVDPHIVNELLMKFSEFRKAYEDDGMQIEDFDSYGATVRTLRGFTQACHNLSVLIRDFLLPNPDV